MEVVLINIIKYSISIAKLFNVLVATREDNLEKDRRKVNEKSWFSRFGRNISDFITEDVGLLRHEDHANT